MIYRDNKNTANIFYDTQFYLWRLLDVHTVFLVVGQFKVIRNSFAKAALIIVVIFSGGTQIAHAQDLHRALTSNNLDCVPVDIVFVTDESEQMSMVDYGSMRIESIKWFVNFLGFDVLLSCPNVIHRVALVGFNDNSGSDPSRYLELTPINPDIFSDNPWNSWEAEFQAITGNLQVNNTGVRDYDALENALESAFDILKGAPPIGSVQRKQAVVLLIGGNGMWCDELWNCAHYQVDHQKKKLHGFLEQQEENISLSVITLGSGYVAYDPKGFWQSETSAHHGALYAERKGVSIGQSLMDIYQGLSPNSDIVQACGSLNADPFIDKLGFNILLDVTASRDIVFQDSLGASYTLQDVSENGFTAPLLPNTQIPDGTRFLYGTKSDLPDKAAYYLFGSPTPGVWEFDADCNNNKAFVIVQMVRASRVLITEPSSVLPQYRSQTQIFDPNKPYYLKFQIVDQEGISIKEYSGYEAEISAMILEPQGTNYPLTFDYDSSFFTSNEALPVNMTGDYGIEIEFNIPSADPNFQDQNVAIIHYEGTYNVSSRMPFHLSIDYPTSSANVPLHGGFQTFEYFLGFRPVEARVRLDLDLQNVDVKPEITDIILGDGNRVIKALLYDSSNSITEEIWLQPSPTDPFLFTGTFSNEKFLSGGDYSLKVSLEDKQYNEEKYLYLPDPQIERVDFKRQDGVLDTPYSYYILFLIFLSAMLWFLGWFVFSITDPAQGYLLFYPPGRKTKPFVLLDLTNAKLPGSKSWTSALLKFIPAKLRWVRFDEKILQEESMFLKNLNSIEVYTPRLGGKSQKIKIIETSIDQPLEWDVEKEAHNVKIGTTSAHYEIYYSVQLPQDTQDTKKG